MIAAKTAVVIAAFCSSYLGYPHYRHEVEVCEHHGEFYASSMKCHKELVPSDDFNIDGRKDCKEVYMDCVRDIGEKSCAKKIRGVVDDVLDWEFYAPADAMRSYKRANHYTWRKK